MMNTQTRDYSHQQLVDKLLSDYVDYFMSDYDDDDSLYSSPDEYHSYLTSLSHSQLVEEFNSQN